jgi:hypothetical protein
MNIIKFAIIVLDMLIDDQEKINRPCHLNRCSKIVRRNCKTSQDHGLHITHIEGSHTSQDFTYITNVNDKYQL